LASKVNGKWETTSTQSLVDQANAASRGMLAMGIGPGDKIAMISNNRTEWAIMDMAILQIGAINVPIYPTITEDDYRYIFNHAEIKMCFVSDEELLTKVRNIASDVPSMDKIFTFDTIAGADHWSAVKDAGQGGDQAKVDTLKDAVKNEDIATIIYTSGTTGTPKGVLLTHNNVLSNAIASKDRLPVDTNAKSLSFLPICHIYERMLLYLYFYTGVSIYFAESLETIGDNLKEIKPEVFSAVPRLLEKVYDKIIEKGAALTGVKKALFFWAVSLGEQWEPYGANGAWYEFKLRIAKKIIFSKWQEALGGNALAVASGSAALQPRLARIFNAAGIPIMEGYGLTETSPVVAVNEMDNRGFMIGSVGRVLKDVEVKIAEDGEILVKGPNVMQGYYKDEEKTKEVFTEDGWFKTGDIGVMTGEGNAFLKITDRKKEIFKTSGGKYVAPQPIENELKGSRFIEQAMVVGEGKKHPAVIVVPHFESVEYWCEHHDIQYPGPEAAIKDERITARIWQEVERVNENLGKWEQPKKMALCSTVWGVDTGELTPTLKLKRRNILSKYANLMTDIYGE
jgi:long-chain acyl-CoA synthetase